MVDSGPAILVEGLDKRFGEVQALRGLSFEVAEGTVLGVLGPNGAGKTTAVRILATLIRPDAGRAVDRRLDAVGRRRRPADDAEERALIERTIREGDMLTKLRAAAPATAPARGS